MEDDAPDGGDNLSNLNSLSFHVVHGEGRGVALKNKRNTQKNSQKNGLFLPFLSVKFSVYPRISMFFLLILKYS